MIIYNIDLGREDVAAALAEISLNMEVNVKNLRRTLIAEGCLAGVVLAILVLMLVVKSSVVTICIIAVCLVFILLLLFLLRPIRKRQLKKSLLTINSGRIIRYDVDDTCIRISGAGSVTEVRWDSLCRFGTCGDFLVLKFPGERVVLFDRRELPRDVTEHLWSTALKYAAPVEKP